MDERDTIPIQVKTPVRMGVSGPLQGEGTLSSSSDSGAQLLMGGKRSYRVRSTRGRGSRQGRLKVGRLVVFVDRKWRPFQWQTGVPVSLQAMHGDGPAVTTMGSDDGRTDAPRFEAKKRKKATTKPKSSGKKAAPKKAAPKKAAPKKAATKARQKAKIPYQRGVEAKKKREGREPRANELIPVRSYLRPKE